MKQRTLTGLVLALVSFLLLCCFRLPFVPELATICLGCGAVWEILGACGVKSRLLRAMCYAWAVLLPLLPLGENRYVMSALLVLGLCYFTYLMGRIGKPQKGWMPFVNVFFTVGLYRSLAAFGRLPQGAMRLCLTRGREGIEGELP